MRRVYSNVQIGLISALLLAVVAFEAGAAGVVSSLVGPAEESETAH